MGKFRTEADLIDARDQRLVASLSITQAAIPALNHIMVIAAGVAGREVLLADDEDNNRRTGALVGLAIALALIIAGLFLVQYFRHENAVEDCLLAHRSDCDTLAR